MPKTVPPIPAGSPPISPYLTVRRGKEAIAFYQKAFGAREIMRMDDPQGRIGHAELEIGTGPKSSSVAPTPCTAPDTP